MSGGTSSTTSTSTMAIEGGRRRIDRVLGVGFLDGLTDWSIDELRSKRAEAEQEEVDLSYSRRLLHGRLDLLRAEQQTRSTGRRGLSAESTEQMVAVLAATLADQPTSAYGLGRFVVKIPSRAGEHRRAAEAAVADVEFSHLTALDDAQIISVQEQLIDLEGQVSEARKDVQVVLDTLSDELGRRYREGEARVEEVLTQSSPTL